MKIFSYEDIESDVKNAIKLLINGEMNTPLQCTEQLLTDFKKRDLELDKDFVEQITLLFQAMKDDMNNSDFSNVEEVSAYFMISIGLVMQLSNMQLISNDPNNGLIEIN